MRLLRPLTVVAAALLLAATAALPLSAQEPPTSPPPLPVLVSGSATLDGAPADGVLSVRVGDWETRRPVNVEGGAFVCAAACLIVGPPSYDYVGEPVLFVLDGTYAAAEGLLFPDLPAPSNIEVALTFSSDNTLPPPTPTPAPTPTIAPTPTPTPAPTATPTPAPDAGGAGAPAALAVAAAVAVAAGIAWAALRLRRRR